MACVSLIPNCGDNRARNHYFSDLAAIVFRDNSPSLKISLPDDNRIVVLVPDSQ